MADFASRYLSEIGSGKGLLGGAGRAAAGSMKDVGKTFSKENLVRSFFGGEDIFSTMIRSKFGVKKTPTKEKSPTREGIDATTGVSGDSLAFIKIIAKNSMSLHLMARDVNVLRQNTQKLVKLQGGKKATGADAFFRTEDERERSLEVQRQKVGGAAPTVVTTEAGAGGSGGGFLDGIMKFFSGGFTNAIKSIFNVKTLGKVFSKVFLPIAIIATLFSGIKDGFERYKETGSFSDAIVAGLGGMLDFVSFGLFGEDQLKSVFESVSSFFEPIMGKISEIFTGIKNFFVKLFGGVVDVKDDGPTKAETPAPKMPDPKGFIQTKDGAAGAPKGVLGDLSGVLEAGKTGGFEAMLSKAKEFEQKYPAAPAAPESPVPLTAEGIPLDQAQRNYELNMALTGRAAGALGVPLEAPKPPTAAESMPAPPPPSPSPAPALSKEEKIKQLETYIERNKKRFANREASAKRHIESFSKRYAGDPDRVKELKDDYAATLKTEKAEMESANEAHQKEIDALKKSDGGGTVSSSAPPAAATSSGGGSVSAAGGGESAPAPITAEPPTSGSSLSTASSEVAEAQRMESAADGGSVVNAPVTNNTTGSTGKQPKVPSAETIDSALSGILMRT